MIMKEDYWASSTWIFFEEFIEIFGELVYFSMPILGNIMILAIKLLVEIL